MQERPFNNLPKHGHDVAGYAILGAVFIGTVLVAHWLAKGGSGQQIRFPTDENARTSPGVAVRGGALPRA